MRRYWLTAIVVLIGASSIIGPLPVVVSEDPSTVVRWVVVPLGLVLGVAVLTGVWGLHSGRFSETVSLSFVGVGSVVWGVGFFWMLLVPTVLALLLIWFGIVKRGPVTELHPATDT